MCRSNFVHTLPRYLQIYIFITWNFQLKPVYCVALLDFTFDKVKSETEYLSNVQLKNQYCEVFYDKLTFLFIEMPRFTKTEKELTTHFDKWLYFLKNLEDFTEIPEILNEQIFIEGKIEGKMEAKLEVVKNGIKQGLSSEIISQLTGISIEEIEKMT